MFLAHDNKRRVLAKTMLETQQTNPVVHKEVEVPKNTAGIVCLFCFYYFLHSLLYHKDIFYIIKSLLYYKISFFKDIYLKILNKARNGEGHNIVRP